MKVKLLNFVVCPHCGGDLKLGPIKNGKTVAVEEKNFSNDEEVKEGIIICKECNRVYPIINYVPRLLPDSLRIELVKKNHPDFIDRYRDFFNDEYFPLIEMSEKDKETLEDKKRTLERFGYEWKKYPKIYKEYEDQFLDWIYPLKPEFFKNKNILDAGCGTGRHLYYAAKFGAKNVVGIDLSEAVEVAYENTKEFKNVHIIQADIYHLPLKEKEFDFIYSIGVLHHLPYPEEGFRNLINFLKDKGMIFAWVYGKEGNFLLKIMNPIRKNITSKMPLNLLRLISLCIMIFLHPIIKLIYKPINNSKITKPIAEILPQNEFFYYLSKFSFEQNTSILFDQLLAPIANYYTKEEFESWFKKANLKNIKISWRNKNSWRGFGEK